MGIPLPWLFVVPGHRGISGAPAGPESYFVFWCCFFFFLGCLIPNKGNGRKSHSVVSSSQAPGSAPCYLHYFTATFQQQAGGERRLCPAPNLSCFSLPEGQRAMGGIPWSKGCAGTPRTTSSLAMASRKNNRKWRQSLSAVSPEPLSAGEAGAVFQALGGWDGLHLGPGCSHRTATSSALLIFRPRPQPSGT